MSRLKKPHAEYVGISNPRPGGSRYTTMDGAMAHCLSGRAVFVTVNSIRFLDDDERRARMLDERRKRSASDEQQATAGLGYEWRGRESGDYRVMQAEAGRLWQNRDAR